VRIVPSVQQGDSNSSNTHGESVLRKFKKRINLFRNEKRSILKAKIYNQHDSKIVNLTELKIISKSKVQQASSVFNMEIL